MKRLRLESKVSLVVVLAATMITCTTGPISNSNSPTPATAATPSPAVATTEKALAPPAAVTLPTLNALFTDAAFKTELKSKLNLNDSQIEQLQNSANDEVARLRQGNAEEQTGNAAEARQRATEVIRNAVGEQKTQELFNLINERWVKGSDEAEPGAKTAEFTMLPGPNAVPQDSRIVVNIPAYRMDVFHDGSMVKSYKIGIGYPQFPLPTGLRKAQQIIFNPTWTPPDEPWVASMKDVTVGQKVEAGSKLNPLGPIKVPIGLPNLIHGGKSPAKLGTFASHGCVGLTTPQVKDFAKVLAQTAGSDISDKAMEAYLRDSTKTKVVKLPKTIPVELRYETIVLEDGKLHIYKDVYDQDANTEENLRAVLQANGMSLEDLSQDERAQALDALNAMSTHPTKSAPRAANLNNSANSNQAALGQNKRSAKEKRPAKNQKEVVIEIARLIGKGYPAPVDLDTGTGKPSPKLALKQAAGR